MSKKIITAIFFFIGFFVAQDAVAQVKIGYTNPARIMSQLPEMDKIDQQVQALIKQKDEELAKKATDLQETFSDYEATMNNLSEQERTTREQQLVELNQQFEQDREGMMNEIRQKRSELMTPVIQKMNKAMEEVAAEMGLDLILNEGTSTGDAIIFFANSEKLNVTDQIIEKIK